MDHRDSSVASPLASATREVSRNMSAVKKISNSIASLSKSRGNDKSDVSISALATALDWMHQGYHSIEFELFVAAVDVTPNNTRNKLVSHQVFGGVSRRLNATETTSPTTVVTSSTSKAPVSASPTKNPLTAPPTVKPVTKSPSAAPSTSPVNPTSGPSRHPITSPPSTLSPSRKPITSSPSASPTRQPITSFPSTLSPTLNPVTKSPSAAPSTSPVNPTSGPSRHPITSPPSTLSPSRKPITSSPSASPTRQPITSFPSTLSPTLNPVTKSPSAAPSTSPFNPTSAPSRHPITSSPPTRSPSRKPTSSPVTSNPSAQPTTRSPTRQPSSAPVTATPTNDPSLVSQRSKLRDEYVKTLTSFCLATLSLVTFFTSNAAPLYKTDEDTNFETIKDTQHFPITQVPTFVPSSSPDSLPSSLPSESKITDFTPAPTEQVTETPTTLVTTTMPSLPPQLEATAMPSSSPSNSYNTMQAVLNFKLPFAETMDSDTIVVFEDTVQDFLQKRLESRDGISISNYYATVISQELALVDEQGDDPGSLQNENKELVRRRLSEETYLVVSVLVTAHGTPANSVDEFPFQVVVHNIIARNSDKFYDTLYESLPDAFGKSPVQQPSTESVDLASPQSNGSPANLKSIAVGSSIAGVVVLASLMVFLVMRRRQEQRASNSGSNVISTPPTAYSLSKMDEGDVSSIDDSLVDTYPKNIPHLPPSDGKSSGNEPNPEADQWSLDDTFPIEERLNSIGMAPPPSQMKQVVYVPLDDVDQAEATEKQACDEGAGEAMPDSFSRLYDQAMMGEGDAPKEDATKDEMPPQVHRGGFKIDVTPKSSNDVRSSTTYEVKAPPGPLGIVIDSSSRGPVVHHVKEDSPLFHLVEKGDIILSIDGLDCSRKDANGIAAWIKTKPKKEEQTLTLMGNALWNATPNDDDASV
eukprot:g13458.t1 g13458   contig8:717626-721848(-)